MTLRERTGLVVTPHGDRGPVVERFTDARTGRRLATVRISGQDRVYNADDLRPATTKEPEWMRRKREIGLPAKELTLS